MLLLISAAQHFAFQGKGVYEIRPMDVITDPFGYKAVTSDDTSSLAPSYVWVDKSSDPSTVHLTMSDDDIQGPFNIGFTFPFYWYTVDQFYVHSNGAISFQGGNLWTPHDNYVPNPNAPNDLIVGLGADLNPECSGADIYYWTNNTDSLIITFENVATWRQGTNCEGSHTFQMILTADGNITINYGQQIGGYDYGIGQTAISIGLESVLGNPGMGIYEDGSPATREPRDSFAIRIYYPDSTTFRISDAAAGEIFPNYTTGVSNSGIVVAYDRESNFQPMVTVRNVGTDTLYNTQAVLKILLRYGPTVMYSDTVVISTLPPNHEASVMFSPIDFTTFSENYYTARLEVSHPDDANSTNNKADLEIQMINWTQVDTIAWVDIPTVMGTPLSTRWFGSGGGWMVRFDPRYYPFRIDTAVVMIAGCSSTESGCGPITAPVLLVSESWDTLAQWSVTVNPDTAYIVPLPIPGGVVVNEPVYLYYIQTHNLGPAVIMDTTGPYSRNTYESTNGQTWAPYRDNNTSDFAFMLIGQSLQSTRVAERGGVAGGVLVSKDGVITLAGVEDVEVYDMLGRRLFVGRVDKVIMKTYPPGVYFVKVGGKVLKVVKR